MSKSRHSSTRPNKPATVPAVVPDERAKPPAHPWVIGGIDYGPAIATVRDLSAWAFDLAARDVADWPEGQRRVRTARHFVLDRLRGKCPHPTPLGDVLFTASLLTRIFDADLRLGMSEMVAILDRLGLPTELVPLMPRRQANASAPTHPPITPLRPRPAAAAATPPHDDDDCDGRGQLSLRFREAA